MGPNNCFEFPLIVRVLKPSIAITLKISFRCLPRGQQAVEHHINHTHSGSGMQPMTPNAFRVGGATHLHLPSCEIQGRKKISKMDAKVSNKILPSRALHNMRSAMHTHTSSGSNRSAQIRSIIRRVRLSGSQDLLNTKNLIWQQELSRVTAISSSKHFSLM
jgi:hypothetical protein